MADQPSNPYVGPRTFEERDARHFFGRDRESRELLSLIISEPLVLFFAESGAGKSSLLNARIIPNLRKEGFFVYPTVRVGGELPEDVAEVDNIYAFNLKVSLNQGQVPLSTLAEQPFLDFIAEQRDSLPDAQTPRALIIDQFEEILTTHHDRWEDRERFFALLGQLIKNDPLLWVVLTMREDYVASLDPFLSLIPGKMRARYYMQRMEAPAAILAVREPAAQAGRPFAPGVAEALVDNLRQIRSGPEETAFGQFVEPVQLQVVCYQLWEELKGSDLKEISQTEVDQLGDVDAALAEFYEEAIASVLQDAGVSEMQLRSWFDRRLITEASTRGTAYQGSSETAGLPNELVARLERKFIIRAEIRAGGTWYELIHDRFIAPIQQANQRWRLNQSPLIRAAEEWDRQGRGPELLYRGAQLTSILDAIHRESADPLVQEFLEAAEKAQNECALGRAQQEAEEQTRRAEAEAQIARRLRWLAVALGIFVVAAGAAAYFAFIYADEAIEESERALVTRAAAEVKVTEALLMQSTIQADSTLAAEQQAEAEAAAAQAGTRSAAALATAERANEQAESARVTAESANQAALAAQEAFELTRTAIEDLRQSIQARLLVARIPQFLNRTADTELALLFGVQAYNLNQELGGSDEDIIYDSLRSTLARPVASSSLFQGENTGALAVLPQGEVLISGRADGTLRAWNLAAPEMLPLDFDTDHGSVNALAVHPAGDWIASGHEDGRIVIWEVTRGAENILRDLTPLHTLPGHEGGVRSLNFSTNGRDLVSGGADIAIRFWDTSNLVQEVLAGAVVENADAQVFHNGPIFGVAILPNGQAVSASENRIIFWNRFGEEPTFFKFLTTSRGFTGQMALSSDGNNLAIGVRGRGFFLFRIDEVRSSPSPAPHPFQTDPPTVDALALQFNPGSNPPQLAVYYANRQLHTYDVFINQVSGSRGAVSGGEGVIRSLAYAPRGDGKVLVTGGEGSSLRLWNLTYRNPAAALPTNIENLEEVVAIACAQVRRNMTLSEWQDNLPGEVYRPTCPNWPPHFTAETP